MNWPGIRHSYKISWFVTLIIVSSIFYSSCDQKEMKTEISKLHSVAIDSLMLDYNLTNGPGAALMIIQNANIIYSKGYGLSNLEENTAITSISNFRLASITKQFTAMCIMILKSRGQLDYDQTLTEIFTDFPEYGNDITIQQLLHHTSGIQDYFALIPENVTEQIHDADVLTLMMEQDSLYFTPGTEYRYSNSGYAVLAMIVEQVSGMGFANFLSENIFTPLDMIGSIAFEDGISTVPNRAYGYSFSGNHYALDDQSPTSAVLGDGGIYSSINDMFKWDQALVSSARLVSTKMIQEAFTSGTTTNGEETGYGFGWVLETHRNRIRLGHRGSTRGFRNVYHRYPDEELSIIILTNRNSDNPKKIADQIADMIFGA